MGWAGDETEIDRFDCYELCVQSPRHVVAFLRGVHGNEPVALREDFCGTAAVSRRWAREAKDRGEDGRALAVDNDAEVLSKARRLAAESGVQDRVALVHADALGTDADDGCDVAFVGNFSIGYLHTRGVLLEYLRRSRERLSRGLGGFGGGVFVCDLYGGAGAFALGRLERTHPGRGRERIRYCWVHEAADPITGAVENSISFRVDVDGEIVRELPRAFVYRWRLWSLPELRDAMLEAGFASVEVHTDVNIAPGRAPVPVVDGSTLGPDWIVLVVARV